MIELNLRPETREELENVTLSGMSAYTSLADKIRSSISIIDRVEQYTEKQGHTLPEASKHLRRLSECSLLISLIWLDITAGFRIYLNAKDKYEGIYAVKQLTITINEGFKQIYNYVSIDDNGNLKTRERNHSFWVKDIGAIANNELPHLLNDYDKITASLDTYDDQELKDMKGPRNLFVHFDKTPSLVYDELVKQDVEKITKKILPFMKILKEMIDFSMVLLADYNILITQRKNDMLDNQHQKFESLRSRVSQQPKAMELLDQIQHFIKSQKN
jgi:hypothetical protein